METGREDIFRRITADEALWEEIKERIPPQYAVVDLFAPENRGLEAIVRYLGRPVLKVRNDDFDINELKTETWKSRLEKHQAALRTTILSVGRVELENHPGYDWIGTGWVVADDVIVTNRHVAMEFARNEDGGFVFRHSPFGDIKARLDFHEEYQGGGPAEFHIVEVLHIEEDGGPDMAFLRIDWASNAAGQQRRPIALATEVAAEQMVAVIGYPAKDSRTQVPEEMDKIFGDIYDVKRLAPGQIMRLADAKDLLTHDCTTLGGNSGSIVCDLETGQAVGLHFAGREGLANYAVSAPVVQARLESVLASRKPRPAPVPVVPEAGAPTVESLRNRRGYDPKFLSQPVPLPSLSPELRQQVAPVVGREDGLLRYSHYSVLMHAARRMAIYAVCNIDGKRWRQIPRGTDRWVFDPRLDRAYQAGTELYKSNKLDQGHLVRRLDPAWGRTLKQARFAVEDTFFYTNCSPQHKEMNRELWLALEEYILGNTDVYDLKVTVFNGPVFRPTDRTYRGFRIPDAFWKVVVMVREETKQLSATAYLVSQLDFMDDLEFAFGPFRTYQVPLRQIEALTGLDFGELKAYDPMAEREGLPFVSLSNLADVVV